MLEFIQLSPFYLLLFPLLISSLSGDILYRVFTREDTRMHRWR